MSSFKRRDMSWDFSGDIKCPKNVIFNVSPRRIEGNLGCSHWVIKYKEVTDDVLSSPRPGSLILCLSAGDPALSMSHWMFHQQALQEYILMCCQCPAGGLLDKPGK